MEYKLETEYTHRIKVYDDGEMNISGDDYDLSLMKNRIILHSSETYKQFEMNNLITVFDDSVLSAWKCSLTECLEDKCFKFKLPWNSSAFDYVCLYQLLPPDMPLLRIFSSTLTCYISLYKSSSDFYVSMHQFRAGEELGTECFCWKVFNEKV